MYCIKCGAKLESSEKICPLCETKVYHPDILIEEEKRQFDASLSASRSSGGGGGGGGSSSGSASITKTSGSTTLSADAKKYGTFSNGYQPKGISGYGTVSKTGRTTVVNGKTQNIWKTPDGTEWYWDGSSRTYKKYVKPNGNYKSVGNRINDMISSILGR